MAELADELDETLFTAVLNDDDHVLRYILPDRRNNTYSLRPKRHELMLAIRRDSRSFLKTRINNFLASRKARHTAVKFIGCIAAVRDEITTRCDVDALTTATLPVRCAACNDVRHSFTTTPTCMSNYTVISDLHRQSCARVCVCACGREVGY